MSTKIYQAYKMPVGKFSSDFIPSYRAHCYNKTVERVKVFMECVNEAAAQRLYEKKWASRDNRDELFSHYDKPIRCSLALSLAYASSISPYRSTFDIDCGFNAWLDKGKAYVIPYGEWYIKDSYHAIDGIEDYQYYNNTDQPEDISDREWNARRRTWNRLCIDDWDRSRLLHQVINIKEDIGVYELAKAIVPEKPLLASFIIKDGLSEDSDINLSKLDEESKKLQDEATKE